MNRLLWDADRDIAASSSMDNLSPRRVINESEADL
jgi:hypothetical protein